MSNPVKLRREAKIDLDHAYRYYESEHRGLGGEFLDAVENRFSSIAASPESFAVVYQDIREALLKRFPFAVYFREEKKRRESSSMPFIIAAATPSAGNNGLTCCIRNRCAWNAMMKTKDPRENRNEPRASLQGQNARKPSCYVFPTKRSSFNFLMFKLLRSISRTFSTSLNSP
jgi:hypothetical protein